MSIMICVEATLKEGRQHDAIEFLRERFPETRACEGCHNITAYLNEDGRTMVFIEHWAAQSDFERYLSWRQESGSFAYFSELVEGELKIGSFSTVEV